MQIIAKAQPIWTSRGISTSKLEMAYPSATGALVVADGIRYFWAPVASRVYDYATFQGLVDTLWRAELTRDNEESPSTIESPYAVDFVNSISLTRMKNTSNNVIHIVAYTVAPRFQFASDAGTSNGCALTGPVTDADTLIYGFASGTVGTSAGTNITTGIPANEISLPLQIVTAPNHATPYDAPTFLQTWRIVRTRKVTLHPNECYTFKLVGPAHTMTRRRFATTVANPKTTRCLLFQCTAEIVNDVTTDDLVNNGIGQLICMHTNKVAWRKRYRTARGVNTISTDFYADGGQPPGTITDSYIYGPDAIVRASDVDT